MTPTNQAYVIEHGLNKNLKFGRTVYIPCNKIMVISGENIDMRGQIENEGPVKDVFTFQICTG